MGRPLAPTYWTDKHASFLTHTGLWTQNVGQLSVILIPYPLLVVLHVNRLLHLTVVISSRQSHWAWPTIKSSVHESEHMMRVNRHAHRIVTGSLPGLKRSEPPPKEMLPGDQLRIMLYPWSIRPKKSARYATEGGRPWVMQHCWMQSRASPDCSITLWLLWSPSKAALRYKNGQSTTGPAARPCQSDHRWKL